MNDELIIWHQRHHQVEQARLMLTQAFAAELRFDLSVVLCLRKGGCQETRLLFLKVLPQKYQLQKTVVVPKIKKKNAQKSNVAAQKNVNSMYINILILS